MTVREAKRKEHADNLRMSKLRRRPGKDSDMVARLGSRDEYGDYYVVSCNIDPNGNWKCIHHYHDYPGKTSWHTIFRNGGHYFQRPDGSQGYYHPHKPDWCRCRRETTGAEQMPWSNPRSPCVASVNPPPRWWMEQNKIDPFDGQNELDDALDQRFEDAPTSD